MRKKKTSKKRKFTNNFYIFLLQLILALIILNINFKIKFKIKFKKLIKQSEFNINLIGLFYKHYKLFNYFNNFKIIKFTFDLFLLCVTLNNKYIGIVHKEKCNEQTFRNKIKAFIVFIEMEQFKHYQTVTNIHKEYVYLNSNQYTYARDKGIITIYIQDKNYDLSKKDYFFYNM